MNIVYLRYATVIAKAGSLSKAAEELFVAQPNLSRAIKELEKELDITIFERTSKGIVLTPDGERLIENGKKILRQIDELEKEFTDHLYEKTRFALSAPRASYISRAFAAFSRSLSDIDRAERTCLRTYRRIRAYPHHETRQHAVDSERGYGGRPYGLYRSRVCRSVCSVGFRRGTQKGRTLGRIRASYFRVRQGGKV